MAHILTRSLARKTIIDVRSLNSGSSDNFEIEMKSIYRGSEVWQHQPTHRVNTIAILGPGLGQSLDDAHHISWKENKVFQLAKSPAICY
eukprot:scaffold2189_cov234-Chaetoceros_neogracile.AAC.8